MKRILFLLFVSFTLQVSAQVTKDTTGMEMFNQALDFYNKGNLDSTVIVWTQMVEQKVGYHYDTYGNAFFNIPTVYWQMNNYDKAKEWYKKIILSDLRDNDETGSLMEPHTNYKHKSALALAGLYQLDSNYNEVLHWIDKADTLYPYWGYEGSATSVSKEQAYMLEWKTEILIRLHKPNEAIRAIITELICSRNLEIFFKTSEDTLVKMINKINFQSGFDVAINQLNITQLNDSNWTATFFFEGLTYTIPISNVYPDIYIPHYWSIYFIPEKTTPDKQKLITYIRERNFYLRLSH